MNEHPTLLRYILTKFPQLREDQLLNGNEINSHTASLKAFLESIAVVELPQTTEAIHQIHNEVAKINQLSYPDFIDFILESIAQSRKDERNQITLSVLPKWRVSENRVSFQAHLLKNENWTKLCAKLGRDRFAELLCSIKCCYTLRGVASLMFRKKSVVRKPPPNFVCKSGMYYYWKSTHEFTSVLKPPPLQLVHEITDDPHKSRCRVHPRKSRGLIKVISLAKRKESTFNYLRVFSTTVRRRSSPNVFENVSKLEEVFNFVMTCLNRIFPTTAIGDTHNRTCLRKQVYNFLSLRRYDTFELTKFAKCMKLASIRWLGSSKHTSSVQDHDLRQELLEKFLKWLFKVYITNLVRNFWYVTEIPTEKDTDPCSAYFPHFIWKNLTKVWMERYVSNYLEETIQEKNLGESFNHGFLRVMPKKADFRPLCIPTNYPGMGEIHPSFRAAYRGYDRNVVRPIREILRLQQMKQDTGICPRNYSVRDVCEQIAKFKKALTGKGSTLPALYGVKFDMKHCYDNLNQSKVIELIENSFSETGERDEFYLRRVFTRSRIDLRHFKLLLTIKCQSQIAELNICRYSLQEGKAHYVYSDGLDTWKFTRGTILDVVKLQIVNSTTQLPIDPGKIFRRKRGIFQGRPLLATFCDIVYNQLSDELYTHVDAANDSVLLRLADDFLFISASEAACKRMLLLATSDLALNYGAYINTDKCSMFSSNHQHEMNFVGLEIDIRTLSFKRSKLSSSNIPARAMVSFEKCLAYLQWNFSARLSDHFLDLNLSSANAVLDNIADLLQSSLDCLEGSLPKNINESSENFSKLINFCLWLFKDLTKKDTRINDGELSRSALTPFFVGLMSERLMTRVPGILLLQELLKL